MSSEGSTKKETPEKAMSDITEITRAVNIKFELETGKILQILDKDVEQVILEMREDGTISRMIPLIPLIQETGIVIQTLSIENSLLKVEGDTSREGWKRLQGVLEENIREQRTTAYTTEPIQKGFLHKNAKWIFLAIVVLALLFFYFYLQAAEPRALDLGE